METQQNNNYCIILAGGIGRRLWPAGSKTLPKQFIDFFGTGSTLLQQTFERFARFIQLDHIFVSTYEDYVDLVKAQLPTLPVENILPEPVQLNTAPAAIWGTWHAVLANPEANVVVTPADQLILQPERFEQQVLQGLDYVATHSELLAMGVRPTRPNTAYGYIQMGEPVEGEHLHRVQSFTEKPEYDYAKMFMESGEFLWNTGIFMWNAQTMGDCLTKRSGRPPQSVEMPARQMVTIAEEVEYIRSCFTERMPRQVDLFVLEQCDNVVVQECDYGRADIGCRPELREVCHKDVDGNAVSGNAQVMFSGTQRTIVRLPEQLKAVIVGLDNYMVTENDGVLMICPNSDPDLVRRIITEAQMNFSVAEQN